MRLKALLAARVSFVLNTDADNNPPSREQESNGLMERRIEVLKDRRAYWMEVLRQPAADCQHATRASSNAVLEVWLGTCILMVLAFLRFDLFLSVPLGLVVLLLLARAIRRHMLRSQLLSVLCRHSCSGCGFSLESLMDHTIWNGDVGLGPDHCPECGCPWPLVPPPVPRISMGRGG